MGLMEAFFIIVVTFIATALGNIAAKDLGSASPRLAAKLISKAARRLPAPHRERLAEEWLAHLGETTESSAALWHGLSCYFVASPKLYRQLTGISLWYSCGGKRAFDLIISSIMLMYLVPLFFIVGIAVKVSSRGPVFFMARRRGFGGDHFHAFKFRTMYAPASDGRAIACNETLVSPNLSRGSQTFHAANLDNRITRLGKFLRNTSLDELPLLVNVLIGDMSLVGPPAEPPTISSAPSADYRPGLVGPVQRGHTVAGSDRDNSKYKPSLVNDLRYLIGSMMVILTHRS